MKRIRRALGLILALLMLASISCLPAFAGEFPVVDEPEEYIEPVGDGWQYLAELYGPDSEQWLPVAPGWFLPFRRYYYQFEEHYTENREIEKTLSGYIADQTTCPQFLIGERVMADVGCEIAAMYNAFKMRGYINPCASIIRSVEKSGYLMGRLQPGDMGTDPYAIGEYMTDNSIDYTRFTDYTSMQSAVDAGRGTSEIYIVSYWLRDDISGGLHTVALYTSPSDQKIHAYNVEGALVEKDDFASLVASSRFIVGYSISRIRFKK